MNLNEKIVIEPLGSQHDRKGFDCGTEPLNTYLSKQANQDLKRRIARIFVATSPQCSDKVLGYYTLSSLSIELSHLPSNLSRKLPKHPIPAALIGRLACDKSIHGQGIGKLLLVNAIQRTLAVSDDIAIYAMIVDAIDEQAAEFYRQYGFLNFENDDNRLFLPLRNLS